MALIQAVAADQGASGGSFSVTIASSASGSILVVCILSAGGFSATPTCSDNRGNTYTLLQLDNTADNSPSALFGCAAPLSGVTTITIANGGKITAFVCEESATSNAFDQSNIAPNQSGTSTPTVSITTTTPNQVIYSFCNQGGGQVTMSQSSGTALTGTGITAGQHDNTVATTSMFGQRQVVTSVGTYSGTVNATLASAYDSFIVSIVQPSTGGGFTRLFYPQYTRFQI